VRISNTTYNLDYATEDYAHVKPRGEEIQRRGRQFRPDTDELLPVESTAATS